MLEFLQDLWSFLKTRKKLWLLPIILILTLLGGPGRCQPAVRRGFIHIHLVLKAGQRSDLRVYDCGKTVPAEQRCGRAEPGFRTQYLLSMN